MKLHLKLGMDLFKRLIFAILAGVVGSSCATIAFSDDRGQGVAPTTNVVLAGQFHLLAIGIDSYQHWPTLKTAANDAAEISKTLHDQYGFDEPQVVTLLDNQATRQRIIQSLRELAKTVGPDDSVLVFYAGHGNLDDVTGTGFWIPVEADPDDQSTWISNNDVKSLVRAMKARHVLLVSDSCFAGDFFRGNRGGLPAITDEYIRSAFGKLSRQAITSGALEPVADEGSEGHSWFTYFLLRELRENKSPYLLPSDLWNRIRGGVAANARQEPLLGTLEAAGGEVGGEFVLFRKGLSGTLDALIQQKKEQMTELEKADQAAQQRLASDLAVEQQKQSQLSQLEEQISRLQQNLTQQPTGSDTLRQLQAMVSEKEKQENELAKLKAKNLAKRRAEFEEDCNYYLDIRRNAHSSPELVQKAWETICRKWDVRSDGVAPAELVWRGEQGPGIPRAGEQRRISLGQGKTLEFVYIPPGAFMMGSNDGRSNEKPVHRVQITRGYWMGKYEVTQVQYETLMGNNPSTFKGKNHPVDSVSWENATAFCQRVSQTTGEACRLPTEAEWEYACRYNTSFGWLKRAAWFSENSGYTTHPVGQKEPNQFGLYDMLGNVWELCGDWYGENYYQVSPETDPTGPSSGFLRVLRGGSEGSEAGHVCCAYRGGDSLFVDYRIAGFRVVLSPVH